MSILSDLLTAKAYEAIINIMNQDSIPDKEKLAILLEVEDEIVTYQYQINEKLKQG